MKTALAVLLISALLPLAAVSADDADYAADLEKDIVVVRPETPVETLQKLPNYVGISEKTAGATGLAMNIVIIPPGAKAKAHYHGHESAVYILRGKVKTFYGKNLSKSVINQKGDFIYIPAGVPHQPMNLSDTEEAAAIIARTDPNEQESVRVYEGE